MEQLILKAIDEKYEDYRASEINSDFIEHSQLLKLLEKLRSNPNLEIQKIGESIEKREIFRIKTGKGRIKILLWTQMHGDEPTATAAILDLVNFLIASDSLDELRKAILSKLEIHIIPMLNPDGAERYQRENSINVDLNRDALKLVCDESKLLWDYAVKLKPEFGFNLHDQNSYYTAGRINKTSAISLLVPPMDYVKSINYTREKGMQIILKVNEALSNFIPGHVARYSDEFEPRAFGDNFVKLGISSILIESGFYPGDTKKDFVRKLNLISIITAFNSIIERDHEKLFYADYFEIPENKEMLFDLLLKNLSIKFNERIFMVDIGVNKKKKYNSAARVFSYEGQIAGVGDLSTYWGIEEHDMTGYEISSSEQISIDANLDFEIKKNNMVEFRVEDGSLNKIQK